MNFIQAQWDVHRAESLWSCVNMWQAWLRSPKALSQLLFHSVLPRRRLSRWMTSWCSDTYTESGSEWVYRAGRRGQRPFCCNIVPSSRLNSWPVIHVWVRALFADEGSFKEVIADSSWMFVLEKEEISSCVYLYTPCILIMPHMVLFLPPRIIIASLMSLFLLWLFSLFLVFSPSRLPLYHCSTSLRRDALLSF